MSGFWLPYFSGSVALKPKILGPRHHLEVDEPPTAPVAPPVAPPLAAPTLATLRFETWMKCWWNPDVVGGGGGHVDFMMVKPGKTRKNEKIPPKLQKTWKHALKTPKKAGGHVGLALGVSRYRHVFRCFFNAKKMSHSSEFWYECSPWLNSWHHRCKNFHQQTRPLGVSNPTKKWTWFIANPEKKVPFSPMVWCSPYNMEPFSYTTCTPCKHKRWKTIERNIFTMDKAGHSWEHLQA